MSDISDSSDVVPVKRGGKAVTFSLGASQSTSSVGARPSGARGSEDANSDIAGEDDEKKPLLHIQDGSAASRGGAYSGDRRLSSTALLGAERVLRTRSRLWSTALSAFVVSIPALLVGYTLGFASSALLDLTGDAADVPEAYLFNRFVSDLFAVSYVAYGKESHTKQLPQYSPAVLRASACKFSHLTKANMPIIIANQEIFMTYITI